MFCPNCGTNNTEPVATCIHCNNPMPNMTATPTHKINVGVFFSKFGELMIDTLNVQKKETFAILALVFSIAGLLGNLLPVLGFILATLGVIFASIGLKSNKVGIAKAGLIIGLLIMAFVLLGDTVVSFSDLSKPTYYFWY